MARHGFSHGMAWQDVQQLRYVCVVAVCLHWADGMARHGMARRRCVMWGVAWLWHGMGVAWHLISSSVVEQHVVY